MSSAERGAVLSNSNDEVESLRAYSTYVPLQLIQGRPQVSAEVGEKLFVRQRKQATVHLDLAFRFGV